MDLQQLISQLQGTIGHEHKEQCNLKPVLEHGKGNLEIGKMQLSELLKELVQQSNQLCLNCSLKGIIGGGNHGVNYNA
jgi:hypothetical protein